tara:strand:+ start:208 stop:951 length:744 start_codon:yes stop_codon:yes gene_type:complete
MNRLILCPGIPRSGTTSLWTLLNENNIINGLNKEIHYLAVLHNNYDPMYPTQLIDPHRSYIIDRNIQRGLSYPYSLENYISYLKSHPVDFSQSYFLLPEDFLHEVNNKLRDYFDVKVILMYREPIERLISYVGMLENDSYCFGVNVKNKRDLFLDYINNPKLQTLYSDVKNKFERVFGNVMCLSCEHFFFDNEKHNELAKFLEVPQINRIYDRMNQQNYEVGLSSEDLEQARYKLKDSLDFYATLIS